MIMNNFNHEEQPRKKLDGIFKTTLSILLISGIYYYFSRNPKEKKKVLKFIEKIKKNIFDYIDTKNKNIEE